MPLPNPSSGNARSQKSQRPRLAIPRTRLEINCEIVAAAVLVMLFIYLVMTWTALPDKIPTHFNFSGKPDSWGNKHSLLPLLGLLAVLYVGMSIVQRFPHIYNYPFAITDQNCEKQYLLARQLITVIKAELVCILSYITWQTVEVARGAAPDLTVWFMPAFLGLVLTTTIIYFVKAYRAR